jgi:transposase
MKKINTVTAKKAEKVVIQKLTIGLDLGDRWSWYCVLDEAGEVVLEQKVASTPKAMKGSFRWDAAQPAGARNRDTLALGEPGIE